MSKKNKKRSCLGSLLYILFLPVTYFIEDTKKQHKKYVKEREAEHKRFMRQRYGTHRHGK